MKYKLSKLNPNRESDRKFIEQGMVYRVVQCNPEQEEALKKINALVMESRKALQILEDNDEIIQRLAATVEGVEFNLLNPFASGRGFIED